MYVSNTILYLLDPVPITLYGEGNYALTAIKSISVTEEFLGLGERTTNCQTEEFRADCLSRRYRAKLVDTCHCVPFTMRSHYTEKVPGEIMREMK